MDKLELEGRTQIKSALNNAGLEDIDNLDADEDDNIQEGEESDNLSDYDDDSDLLNHVKNEPWGYVR